MDIKIVSFLKCKQKQDVIPHLLLSKSQNLVNLILYSTNKKQWVSQMQNFAKKQLANDVKLFKCLQVEAFKHIISKFINMNHQRTICVIDIASNQHMLKFKSQLDQTNIDCLKLLDFVLILDKIEGIDKQLFTNQNIKLITTQVNSAKEFIQKQIQNQLQLRPQLSVSTISEADQVKFCQDFNKVFNQVQMDVKVNNGTKEQFSTAEQIYNSNPGVGSYQIRTKQKNNGKTFSKQEKSINPLQWSPSKTKNRQGGW